MSNTNRMNEKKTEKALKLAVVFIASAGFSAAMIITFASLSFLYRDNGVLLTVFIALLVFFVLIAGIGVVLLFDLYRRSLRETNEASKEFAEQLQNFELGRVRLSHANYRSDALNRLQSRINSALAARNENNRAQHQIQSSEIMTPEAMAPAVLNAINESTSYRSGVIAVKAYGSEVIPETIDEALLRTLRLQFHPSLVAKQEEGFYYAYLPSVPAMDELQEMCRQFVAIFSPTVMEKEIDRITYYSARVGIAIFPFVAATQLMDEAKRQLDLNGHAVSISPSDAIPALPDPSFGLAPRRVIALATNERYMLDFRDADGYAQALKVVTDYMVYACREMHYDCCGFIRHEEKSNLFRILMEENIKGGKEGFALFATKNIIMDDQIAPLVDYCNKEAATFLNDVTMIPPEVGEILQSAGVSSALFAPVSNQGKLYGFMYFMSVQRKDDLTLADREAAEQTFAMTAAMLVSIQENENAIDAGNFAEALLSRHGRLSYVVNTETYRLLKISRLTEKNFPEAKIGDTCYHALMGRDTPCEECPLKLGTVKRVITQLGPSEQTLSVIHYRSSLKDAATVLIEKPNLTSVSSNLFDASLGIYNAKALSNDIGREIRNRGTGYVVSLRLLNASEFSVHFPGESLDGLRQSLIRKVQDAGYGEFAYRYDENTLSFLLRSTSKNAMMYFVEQLAETAQSPVDVENGSFTPHYAYSAINYPTEASSNFEMMSMIKNELDRSAKVGNDFILEVGRSRFRKALRKDYIRQLLDLASKTNTIALSLNAIMETSTSHISGIHIHMGLRGFYQEAISVQEFMPIAKEEGFITSFDEMVLQNVGRFLNNYGDTTLKTSGIRAYVINVSVSTVLSDSFLPFMKGFMPQHRFPKNSFFLALSCDEIAGHEDALRPVIAMLHPLGVRFLARSYHPEQTNVTSLKNLGFEAVAISRDTLQNAILSQSSTSSFIRMVTEFEESGIIIVVNGVTSKDERDFCYDMAVPFYIDNREVHNLTPQDFITKLNYQR
ncbi:MAG: EAL domain-containing protein [Erysipelotrichaceae bacterium]|nr:EAL domain-containing protein [Erysipelotrichaceae bacterium]